MKAFLMRVETTNGRRWIAFTEDASTKVVTKKTKRFAIDLLAESLDEKITQVVRYKGIMKASEAALTLADHMGAAEL